MGACDPLLFASQSVQSSKPHISRVCWWQRSDEKSGSRHDRCAQCGDPGKPKLSVSGGHKSITYCLVGRNNGSSSFLTGYGQLLCNCSSVFLHFLMPRQVLIPTAGGKIHTSLIIISGAQPHHTSLRWVWRRVENWTINRFGPTPLLWEAWPL